MVQVKHYFMLCFLRNHSNCFELLCFDPSYSAINLFNSFKFYLYFHFVSFSVFLELLDYAISFFFSLFQGRLHIQQFYRDQNFFFPKEYLISSPSHILGTQNFDILNEKKK
jgi:hypothetical protein